MLVWDFDCLYVIGSWNKAAEDKYWVKKIIQEWTFLKQQLANIKYNYGYQHIISKHDSKQPQMLVQCSKGSHQLQELLPQQVFWKSTLFCIALSTAFYLFIHIFSIDVLALHDLKQTYGLEHNGT